VIVVFTYWDNLPCRITRWFDGGPFCHCFPVFDDHAIQSLPKNGVFECFADSAVAGSTHQAYWLPDDSEDTAKAAEAYARSLIGAPYDRTAIPALAIRSIFGTGPHWENPGAYYCDEMTLLAAAVANAKVRKAINGWAGRYGVEAARQILIDAGAIAV